MKPAGRHVHQFRIGALEMERSRHLVVREAYAKRVVAIDERLLGIEREIADRQAILAATPFAPPPPRPAPRSAVPGPDEGPGGSGGVRRVLRYGMAATSARSATAQHARSEDSADRSETTEGSP